MAYSIDPTNGDIIIQGFQAGIADSPFTGISDLRNINIVSTPGEAAVNFATASQVASVQNVVVTGINTGTGVLSFASTAGLKNGQAIYWNQLGSLTLNSPTGVGITWLQNVTLTSATLSSTYNTSTPVVLGGSAAGSPTFSTTLVGGTNHLAPTNFAFDGQYYWMLDGAGQVWSTMSPLATGGGTQWTYTGNSVPGSAYTNGNGLVYYQSTTGVGYILVIHNASIDYTKTITGNFGWIYQWNPATGMAAGFSTTPSALGGFNSTGNHYAISASDNAVYYCDGSGIGSILPTGNTATPFDPTNTATYVWSGTLSTGYGAGYWALAIPSNDTAISLAELGVNLLVGGSRNLIYPWSRVAQVSGTSINSSYSYPIWLAESVVSFMITVNTNTYIFCGNRGRIYITNGTQAQLYKKVPDYLSGTVEPYFYWGGVCGTKNQIYFSFYSYANGGNALATTGGVWAIDLDTQAMRMANQLSFTTPFAGYASALIAINPPVNQLNLVPPGSGYFAGWQNLPPNNNPTAAGIDSTVSTIYHAGESYVTSDMIPIGTLLQPSTPLQVEFKLSTPLLTSETVELQTATSLYGSFTSQLITNGDGVLVSGISQGMNINPSQWLLVKAILTGKTSSPSYNRLVQIRIKGATSKDNIPTQPFSLQ